MSEAVKTEPGDSRPKPVAEPPDRKRRRTGPVSLKAKEVVNVCRQAGVPVDPIPKHSLWARLFVAETFRLRKDVGHRKSLDENFEDGKWHP